MRQKYGYEPEVTSEVDGVTGFPGPLVSDELREALAFPLNDLPAKASTNSENNEEQNQRSQLFRTDVVVILGQSAMYL